MLPAPIPSPAFVYPPPLAVETSELLPKARDDWDRCRKRLRFIAVVFVLGAGIPFLVWLMASFVPKNIKQQALELSFNSVGSDSLYPPDKPSSMATDTNATRDMIKAATSPASRGRDS